MTNQTYAERVADTMDLKRQIGELRDISDSEVVFQDTSPPKRWEPLWSMQTGERILVARHRLEHVLGKRRPDGGPMFTPRQAEAPEYKLGSVKCFLAQGSEEREIVDALHIAPGYYCKAEHLANEAAARIHAEHKHPTSWRMFRESQDKAEREQDRLERRQQTEAMLTLAKGRAGKASD